MSGMLRRRLPRLAVSLFIRIVTSLLSAGSRGHRLQPVHEHGTGDSPKDHRACEQNRSDHAKANEDALHHVIRNYQRGAGTERSIEIVRRGADQTPAANLST